MEQVALKLEQLTSGEDLVNGHLLGDVTQALSDGAGILQGIDAIDADTSSIRS